MEFFQALIKHNSHHLAAKWFRYEDTCSKTFFDFHRIKKKKTLLKELEVDGKIISNHGDLSHYITKFHAKSFLHFISTHFGHLRSTKEMLGKRPHPGHEDNERQHDLDLDPRGGH